MSDKNAARTPANQNPWYVLMTLYGEQDGEEIDAVLHERNREAWNTWAGFALPEAIRDDCAAKGMALPDRDMWDMRGAEIRTLHQSEMLRRNGSDFAYPGFPEASLTEGINLSRLDFPYHLGAQGFVFPVNVIFGSSEFHASAQFDKASFGENAFFLSATFRGIASFNHTAFGVDAHFNSATFAEEAHFNGATFKGLSYYSSAKFCKKVEFTAAKFMDYALFESSHFSAEAGFSHVTFSGDVTFTLTTFGSEAGFYSASFDGYSEFHGARFHGLARFNSATFNDFTYFQEAQFGTAGTDHTVTFSDCQFLKPTNFRAAIFHSHYPDLSGAVLHDKTEFTARPENWPRIPRQPAEDAKAACARIRHAVAKQGLPEEEHFFYRREMDFACRIGSFWQRLPYRLFGLLSGFGYSIQRPTEALLLLWVYPAVFFFGHAQNGRLADYPEIGRALALSLANIFNFLGFHRTFFAPDHVLRLPAALQLLSGFQTLAGLPLLFFLGLALRTRFRLR